MLNELCQNKTTVPEAVILSAWKDSILHSSAYYLQRNGDEERYWERHAGEYERNRTAGPHYQRVAVWLSAKIPRGASVVEIGPGPGIFSGVLADRSRKVTAVEPSAALAAWMRRAMAHRSNVSVVQERWEDVSLDCHDYVFSSGTLHLFSDIREAVKKMIAHARSKVLLVLIDDDRALQREAADLLGLEERCPGEHLATLFPEVLTYLGIDFTWERFTEDQTYRYANLERLISLWGEDLKIDGQSRNRLLAFFKDKGLCSGADAEVIVPRRFTSHLVEISV